MSYKVKILALIACWPLLTVAQPSLDEEVNAELDRMYQGQAPAATPGVSSAPAVQVNVQAQPQVTATQSSSQSARKGAMQAESQIQTQAPIQTATVVAPPVQKQPTTYIEASPLVESRAEKIRKSRQDAEVSTEQTIVEKLEQSRLEDEKRRAEVLFGDKFNTLMGQGQQQPAVHPAAPPVVPVVVPEQTVQAPVPVVVREEAVDKEAQDRVEREMIRSEVNAALAEMKTEPKPEEKYQPKTYFSLMAGSGEYPDAVNVKGQYSFGVGFGRKITDRIAVEGSFQYSNYQVEQPAQYGNGGQVCTGPYGTNCEYYPRITDMNQYGTSGLVKYQILGGSLRPEIGALMAYTYRTFTDTQFAVSNASVSSQALDWGMMVGASLELTESFALGLDYRYMWNISNKVDGTALQKSSLYKPNANYTPIEEMNYYNLSVVGRATF